MSPSRIPVRGRPTPTAVRHSASRRAGFIIALTTLASAACSQEIKAAPADTRDEVPRTASTAPAVELTALLNAARGAPAPLCALAARAVGSLDWWGQPNDAPRTPLGRVALVTSTDGGMDEAPRTRWTVSEQTLLLDNMNTPDLCVRELAVRLLTTRGGRDASSTATSQIVAKTEAQDSSVREVAAFGLGMLAHPSATNALLRLLRDPATGVRANAAWALGRVDDGRALSGLLAVVDDHHADVRWAAVQSLGQLDSSRALPAVLRALQQDTSASVRRVAAWAIAQLGGGATAVATLGSVLAKDTNATVREMCAWALGELEAEEAIAPLSDAAVRDRAPAVRETAVWALGEIEANTSAPTLGSVLVNDTSLAVRRTAAWALGQLNIRTAPRSLIAALTDSDDRLRLNASWALSEIHDPLSVPALKVALAKETHKQARRAQLRGILAAGGRTESMMADLLQSSDPAVREAAIRGVAGGNMVDPWPWPWPRPRPFP